MPLSCLEPLVSDEVVRPDLILPSWAAVPEISDNPELLAQLEKELDYPQVIPRLSGFAGGKPVKYWDFGPVPRAHLPIFIVVRADDAGPFDTPEGRFAPVAEHPAIIDSIPGDPGYSPLWSLQLLPITSSYDGEKLTSLDAITQAIQRGLIEPAIRLPMVVDCPVVLSEMLLETGAAEPAAPDSGFYRGHVVYYHAVGLVPFDGETLGTQELYSLRREGGEPLSEWLRGVDMSGDGDLLDSNNVFQFSSSSAQSSPLVRTVDVVVNTSTTSIDTSGDDTVAAIQGAEALFPGGTPEPGTVIAVYREDPELYNRPVQAEEL